MRADAQKKKVDVFFVVYAAAGRYDALSTQFKSFGGLWYFVESTEAEKLVASQQGYQFTLADLSVS